MFTSAFQVGVPSMRKMCFIPSSYPRAKNSIATSSTIKPSKLIAPTTAGHQTLPSPSWRSRLPQGFLMTVKAPRGRSALQASLLADRRSHPRVGKSGATCVRLLQQRRRGKCSSERFRAKNFCGQRYFLTDSD